MTGMCLGSEREVRSDGQQSEVVTLVVGLQRIDKYGNVG
jgi:hypothetical protein